MHNASGFGTKVRVLALQTFPVGFTLSAFADDEDPLSIEEVEPTGYEMLFDGSLFAFDKAAPILVSVAVIPGSDDDSNLKVLLGTRKSQTSILPIEDVTSMTISYPTGTVVLTNGTILRGPMADSIQQTGRKKSNVYTFVFGSFAGAQSTRQLISTVAQNVVSLL